MSESSTQHRPPPPPPTDECPDPYGPYTDYRVAVFVAKQRSDLYAADAAVVDPRYGKLDGAQGRYATVWSAQRSAWEDLRCRLKRIVETLDRTLDEPTRRHLSDCWRRVREETDTETAPADCSEIDEIDCDDLDDLVEGEPSPAEVATLRQQAVLAETCVAQADAAFDDLAGFPDGLAAQITALVDRATKLDQDLASAGGDQRRSYVDYLAIHRDFCRLEERLTTAARYACKLKDAFVTMLRRHRIRICIKVAVAAIDKRAEIDAEAKKAKAGHIVDLVLECARDEPTEAAAASAALPPGQA